MVQKYAQKVNKRIDGKKNYNYHMEGAVRDICGEEIAQQLL